MQGRGGGVLRGQQEGPLWQWIQQEAPGPSTHTGWSAYSPPELYRYRAPGCRRELSFCKMLSLREHGKVYTDLSVLLFITAMPMNLQLSP